MHSFHSIHIFIYIFIYTYTYTYAFVPYRKSLMTRTTRIRRMRLRAGISELARPMKLTATTSVSNQFQGSRTKGLLGRNYVLYIHICICICIYIRICIYIYIYVCICIYIYVYSYIYVIPVQVVLMHIHSNTFVYVYIRIHARTLAYLRYAEVSKETYYKAKETY